MTETIRTEATRTNGAEPETAAYDPAGADDQAPLHVDTSHPAPFVERHIGPSPDDVVAMLEVVGQPSLDALVDVAIPTGIRSQRALRLDAAPSESAVVRELRGLANLNTVMRSMIGLGYHGTVTPPVVQRNVLESPAWYTAYTPYQPEISQGRLEALLNFQTVVSDLTGLPVAGASLLDESTAVAEAMTLMRRTAKSAGRRRPPRRPAHPAAVDRRDPDPRPAARDRGGGRRPRPRRQRRRAARGRRRS